MNNTISQTFRLSALPNDILNQVLSQLSTHFVGKTVALVSKDFRQRSEYFNEAHFVDHRISRCIQLCRRNQQHETWTDLLDGAVKLTVPAPMIVSRVSWLGQSIAVLPASEKVSARSAILKTSQATAQIIADVVDAVLQEHLSRVCAAGRDGTVEKLTDLLSREFDLGVPDQALAVLRWLIKTSDGWEKENMQQTYYLFNKPEFMDVMCNAVAWTTFADSDTEREKLMTQLCTQFDKRYDDLLFEFAQGASEKWHRLESQKKTFSDAVADSIHVLPADKRMPILLRLPELSLKGMRALCEVLSTPGAVADKAFRANFTTLMYRFKYDEASFQMDAVPVFGKRIQLLGDEPRKKSIAQLMQFLDRPAESAGDGRRHQYWTALKKELPELELAFLSVDDSTAASTGTAHA